MAVATVDTARVELREGESVLDGLLRHGIDHPHGCKSGVCQSCVLQLTEGEVPRDAQQALNSAQQQLGYFLACQCKPAADIVAVSSAQAAIKVTAQVVSKDMLNPQVIRLRLQSALDFRAGQYISLWNTQQQSRCYSIACRPGNAGIIELHIKLLPDGIFSGWIRDDVSEGDSLQISGPMGECFYTADAQQPLLLAGIGTGLAPLCGILEDALAAQHQGPISLIAAAKHSSQLYFMDELKALERRHDNLYVHFLAQTLEHPESDVLQADIYAFVKEQHAQCKNYRVFLCGAESFVKKMKKHIFLAGANMKDISADAFLPSG